MDIKEFTLRATRKVLYLAQKSLKKDDGKMQGHQYYEYVELYDADANDYVYNVLSQGKPCMVSKFGTIELAAALQYRMHLKAQIGEVKFSHYKDFLLGRIPSAGWLGKSLCRLCSNAGFFPDDVSLLSRYYDENVEAMKQIDILGSYIYGEKYFAEELKQARRVNLDGYYAPFYYEHPWTRVLRGKRVLVVHPFAEDIKSQYARREKIWENQEILPEFTLITYKAVQSMLGTKTEYVTWFDALQKMKDDISKIDFDIALVGCGAYGMPLAAHIKQMGRQAVHLAGWTQILFGIIGLRWQNNPRVAPMMNEYWIHPSKSSIPTNHTKVEGGCYW